MTGLVRKSLDSPEETRPFEGGTGQLELVNMDGGAVGRATFLRLATVAHEWACHRLETRDPNGSGARLP
jgi:hypothetical protein